MIKGLIPENYVVPTNNINQVKTVVGSVDSSQVSWVQEQTTGKYKMNIELGDQIALAMNGCYMINRSITQIINGVIINVPVSETYFFDAKGNMMTGWIHTLDDKWYYAETDKGIREAMMVFGWKQIQNKWYYFTPDGYMLANSLTPDGYAAGTDGAYIQ